LFCFLWRLSFLLVHCDFFFSDCFQYFLHSITQCNLRCTHFNLKILSHNKSCCQLHFYTMFLLIKEWIKMKSVLIFDCSVFRDAVFFFLLSLPFCFVFIGLNDWFIYAPVQSIQTSNVVHHWCRSHPGNCSIIFCVNYLICSGATTSICFLFLFIRVFCYLIVPKKWQNAT